MTRPATALVGFAPIGPTDAALLGWKQSFQLPGEVLGEEAN